MTSIYLDHLQSIRLILGLSVVYGCIGLVANPEKLLWLSLIGTVIAAWVVIEITNDYFARRHVPLLPPLSLWLITVAVLVDTVGNVQSWYSSIQWYDTAVHFLSGLALTHALFHGIVSLLAMHRSSLPMSYAKFVAVAVTALLSFLFELFEYLADSLTGVSFWLGTGADTVLDMTAGLAGALLVVWLSQPKKVQQTRQHPATTPLVSPNTRLQAITIKRS